MGFLTNMSKQKCYRCEPLELLGLQNVIATLTNMKYNLYCFSLSKNKKAKVPQYEKQHHAREWP